MPTVDSPYDLSDVTVTEMYFLQNIDCCCWMSAWRNLLHEFVQSLIWNVIYHQCLAAERFVIMSSVSDEDSGFFYFLSTEVCCMKIQNKLLGKCLQVQVRRVSLADCSPYSALQEWRWLPESQALSSQHTGECLTAPGEQYEGVHLKPCISQGESDKSGTTPASVGLSSEASSQTWSCSKKGHLTLIGSGLHLSATQESTLVFLSREHKQVGIFKRRNRRSCMTSIRLY